MLINYEIKIYPDGNLAASFEEYIYNAKLYINPNDYDKLFKMLDVIDLDDFLDLYRNYVVVDVAYIDVLAGDCKGFVGKFLGYGENIYVAFYKYGNSFKLIGISYNAKEAAGFIPFEYDATHEFDTFFNELSYPFMRLKDFTMLNKDNAYLIVSHEALYNEDLEKINNYLALKLFKEIETTWLKPLSLVIDITDVFSPVLLEIDYEYRGNKKKLLINSSKPLSFYKELKDISKNKELVQNSIDLVIEDLELESQRLIASKMDDERIDYAYSLSMKLIKRFGLIEGNDNPYAGYYAELDLKIFEVYEDAVSIIEAPDRLFAYKDFPYYSDDVIEKHITEIMNRLPKKEELRLLFNELNNDFKYIYEHKERLKGFSNLILKLKSYNLQKNDRAQGIIKSFNDLLKRIGAIRREALNTINSYLEEFDSYPNEETLDKIFDMELELTPDEELLVKDRLDVLELYNTASEESFSDDYRRVYIKRSLSKLYLSLDKEIREEINEIVSKLKSLRGREFTSYLYKLRANSPYDRINHKVRIKNSKGLPYRFCFWFGKDFSDREFTKNDIYIYHFVMDHDNDIKKMKELTPSKYKENDFIIYPYDISNRDFIVNLPELKENQLRLSELNKGPSVIYGCAGSGKTLVSVDQYFQIVRPMSTYNDGNIAYITYQDILKRTASDYVRAYGVKPYTYTINEYFLHALRRNNDINISNEKTFIAWFNDYYVINGHLFNRRGAISNIINKPSADQICYTYYRGVFKGSKLLYDKLSYNKPRYTLAREEFLEELKKEEFLSKEEIDDIYMVCDTYYQYTINNNMLDDNDLAIEVLLEGKGNSLKRCDNIIVDEVQDLTSLQLRSLILTLGRGSTNIFFYGDPHQTINPTIFDDSILRTAVKDILGSNVELDEENALMGIHRTNENLKLYLEYLQSLRIKWLGSYMDNYAKIVNVKNNLIEADELAKGEAKVDSRDLRWASLLTKEELKPIALKKAIESLASIIVPNSKEKDRIALKYKISKERIFTIYEAKGMEWDRVILYNLVSDALQYFKLMTMGKAKKSTICRMLFNKFYVGCTRARETFIIIEDNIDDDLSDALFDNIVRIDEASQIDIYFDARAGFEDWINEAKRFIINNEFNRAAYPLSMAKLTASTKEDLRLVNRLIRRKKSTSAMDSELRGYAWDYFNNKDYKEAMFYFKLLRMWDCYNLCKLILDEEISNEEYLRSLLDSEIFKENEWCHVHLANQRYFYVILEKLYARLKGE